MLLPLLQMMNPFGGSSDMSAQEQEQQQNGVPFGLPPPHILQQMLEQAMQSFNKENSDSAQGDQQQQPQQGAGGPNTLMNMLSAEEKRDLFENMDPEERKRLMEAMSGTGKVSEHEQRLLMGTLPHPRSVRLSLRLHLILTACNCSNSATCV